jgi:cytochrome b involved in lipid metabolism
MIIQGNVYDVTPYFDYHPGGHRALMNFAGKDGTENVEFHSPKMMELLDKYFYIGRLEGTKDYSCVIS